MPAYIVKWWTRGRSGTSTVIAASHEAAVSVIDHLEGKLIAHSVTAVPQLPSTKRSRKCRATS